MALHEPAVTLKLLRDAATVDLFFEGLRMHYVESFASGKAETWRACAHALIELIYTADAPPYETASALRSRAKP